LPKQLTVNNVPYQYPEAGDPPGWGEEATGWAEEVTDVLNSLQGPNDINETVASIANNQSSSIEIPGLLFDPGSVRGAEIKYTIYRITDDFPSGNAEYGEIHAIYDNSAAVNEKWKISTEYTGDSGVNITVSDIGQFFYTSTDITGANYQGIMKFTGRALESTI
jgi:hypothetical protein